MADDLINRQEAIDLLEEQFVYLQKLNWKENPTAEHEQAGVNWCINTLLEMPAEESNRNKGEWDNISDDCNQDSLWACDQCRFVIETKIPEEYRFCPNCGARMKRPKVKR